MQHHGVRKFLFATLIFVVLMLIISGSGFILQAARAQANRDQTEDRAQVQAGQEGDLTGTLKVAGSAEVRVEPDSTLIWLGVETSAASASEALEQNNQQVEALVAALTDAGVEQQAIQTQNLQLYPRYEETEAAPDQPAGTAIAGYTARNTVELRIGSVENAGDILDTAVESGANTIDGIQFSVEDRTEAENQARELAVEDARRKAEQLATLAGGELGAIVSIDASETPAFPGLFGGGVAEAADRAAVPVSPGTQAVRVDLIVTWQLVVTGVLPSTGAPAGTATTTAPGTVTATRTATAPGTVAATGTVTSTEVVSQVSITPLRGAPGSTVLVRGTGFEAGQEVNIGLGRSGEDYEIVDTMEVAGDGTLSAQVVIPDDAEVNERWYVVVVLGEGGQTNEITSNLFTVTGP